MLRDSAAVVSFNGRRQRHSSTVVDIEVLNLEQGGSVTQFSFFSGAKNSYSWLGFCVNNASADITPVTRHT